MAEASGLGKPGKGIFRGDASERNGSRDEVLDAFAAEKSLDEVLARVGLRKRAGRLPANRILQSVDLAQADEGGEFVAFANDNFGIGCPARMALATMSAAS